MDVWTLRQFSTETLLAMYRELCTMGDYSPLTSYGPASTRTLVADELQSRGVIVTRIATDRYGR